MTDRFDNFTQRARRALQLAQEEAQRLNQPVIGMEHILLGLVREGDGVAGRVLANRGVDLYETRPAVEAAYGTGVGKVTGEMGLDPGAKLAIERAVSEARNLGHHYIGTEHLLLGILDVNDDGIVALLKDLGAPPEMVRADVLEILSKPTGHSTIAERVKSALRSPTSAKRPTKFDRFDQFTERARKALQLAQEEAQRFNHNYIGTEHILLGLVRQGDGVAAQVFKSLGVELNKVRSAVEFIIGRGDFVVMGEIGLTPRAKRVIELAVDEARRLNHHYIGTEHLLLGIVREGEGIAAGVLESLGVSLEKLRARVIEVLKSSSGEAGEPPDSESIPKEELTGSVPMGGEMGGREAGGSWVEVPLGSIQEPGIEILRTLFDYSIWARDQLLPLIEGLEGEERKKGEQRGVYGSIHDTLAHMAQSEWLWIQRCLGDSPMRLPKGEDFPTLTSLIDWWNEVHAQAILYLNRIADADLQSDLTYLAPDGKQRTRKIWHMLIQVPNHQTEHRSQIATMLGAMGLEVPQTDMVVYLSGLKRE